MTAAAMPECAVAIETNSETPREGVVRGQMKGAT